MTPEEVAAVSSAGLALFEEVTSDIFLSVLSGIYFLAYCISLYIHFRTKGNAGNAKKAMICVLLGNFVLMLMLFVSFVALVMPDFVKYKLLVTHPEGIMEQIIADDLQSHLKVYNTICSWLGNFIQLIADIVIVWRAWAVWIDNATVKWTLLLLMLADIAVCLADTAVDSTMLAPMSSSSQSSSESINLDWVAVVLSLSVNMVATCSIAFRAWLHYKSMKSISIRRKKTKGERILLLLLESGAVYMLFQLLVITTDALNVNAPASSTVGFVGTLATRLYISAASLNPVIIFILVQTHMTKVSTLKKFLHSVNKLSHSRFWHFL
ncbi:hypothetical protein BDP27DRAFT_1454983 [Rhodocollybia butyracea]|uniref:Uncharacterized protein n=1 Tax=Rhodocollybia butyracea TaxID=206335 RepID=A0A9P5P6G9_9AGAR|nr:hypothetical protein BDP27DRAFT_1454983 [Rhodocollybia butyracea]